MQEIKLIGEYITLGQVLKIAGIIDAGGQARGFLESVEVRVNGERESRRGRKLYPGDRVAIPNAGQIRIV